MKRTEKRTQCNFQETGKAGNFIFEYDFSMHSKCTENEYVTVNSWKNKDLQTKNKFQ